MKRRYFFENIRSILWFAVVGTFVSTVVVGVLLYAVGRLGISVQLSIAECLTFGALISATVRWFYPLPSSVVFARASS